ncbi:LLM class flavin-dependent oxidoreductase [Actinacidiphila reveromycinica]|uniref:LLM class flavin-dependent oxidoreductase n=1 Tax=Actinacidiphila reveromycinica TaxID=659352 RepID=UPI003D2D84EC
MAAKTERVKLLALVTAVVFREPGLLAKAVTTLDVLSGGRAVLGIGAAAHADTHADAAGPSRRSPSGSSGSGGAARRPAHVEWLGGPVRRPALPPGPYAQLPAGAVPPHPTILVGGEGGRKTLKRVARHAGACTIGVYDLDATPANWTSSAGTAPTRAAMTTGWIRRQGIASTWGGTARRQQDVEHLHAVAEVASPSPTAPCSGSANPVGSTRSASGSSPPSRRSGRRSRRGNPCRMPDWPG